VEGRVGDACGSRAPEGRAGAACGARLVPDGLVEGAGSVVRGSGGVREMGARGLVLVGAGLTPLGSVACGPVDCGGVARVAGGVRTGSRALGRLCRVGRDRVVSGTCCVTPDRGGSCGLARGATVDRRVGVAPALDERASGAAAREGEAALLRTAEPVRGDAATGDSL
jgi:hypothetical protein